jgi:urease accessory protein
MPRVLRVVAAPHGGGARPLDSVMLKSDQRRVQRGDLVGVDGTHCVLDLPEPVTLRMGDVLELDGGGLVEVVVEAEPLIEVRGRDLTHLARLAWHLGDRHVPVQVFSNRLRLRRDTAIEALLAGLGARVTAIEAPFDPEGGAYAAAAHHHHGHDHGHDHSDYGHDHDTHGHQHHDDHGHHGHEH